MSHHKRRRPKHQRAGCLLCKPHKDERCKKSMRVSDAKRIPMFRPGTSRGPLVDYEVVLERVRDLL